MSDRNGCMADAGPSVLVVDDEAFFREQIRDVLAAASIESATATTGEEVLESACGSDVGVVVLDISLPGISGIEVLEQLLSERPMLRVIIVSADTEQDLVLAALRLGACDYLAKPLHEEELVLAVQRARTSYQVESRGAILRNRLAALEDQLARLAAPGPGGDPDLAIEQRVADAVAEVLGASKTSLMLLGDDGRELRVVAATGRELLPSEMDSVPIGEGVAGVALAGEQALLVDDLEFDERFGQRTPRGRYRTRSLALVPVRGASGPLGVLCATDRLDDAPFCEDDLSLLRILSLGVGAALARGGGEPEPGSASSGEVEADFAAGAATPTPAYASTNASRAETSDAELARRICDALTAEIEPGRLIAAVLRSVAESVPAAPVSLYLLDASRQQLLLEAQCELASHADHERLPADRGLTGAVCQTGNLIATDAPDSDPRFDAAVDSPEGSPPRPLLCLPLVLRNKTLGVVRVFPEQGVSASARTGEILTAAISAAVRNVLMYRSLLESVDEVARARREAHRPI
ncbi:MAG: response regulator [Myxococcota bacterium]